MKSNQYWAAAGRALAVLTVMLIATFLLASSVWAQNGDSPERIWTAWVSWHSWDGNDPGTVVGTIVTSTQKITVTYTGEVQFVELEHSGINYFRPKTTFSCAQVINAPRRGNMIAISGTADPHNFSFSPPIRNPVMAIVSLGQGGFPVDYNFSAEPKILVQGREKYWGGGKHDLKIIGETTLEGTEGDGLIQFSGKYRALSWTVTSGEYWHGFTVGLPPHSED